jgi:multiple sugar transport system substrate-binding protein
MRKVAAIVAAILALTPLDTRAADLVVWWEKGYYPQEDDAVREMVAAFDRKTGRHVELVFYSNEDLPNALEAGLKAGQPPDFAFGFRVYNHLSEWAYQDQLIDVSDEILPFASLFDPDGLAFATLFNATTGRRALYGLPIGIRDQPCPRLAQPARARGLHARRCS